MQRQRALQLIPAGWPGLFVVLRPVRSLCGSLFRYPLHSAARIYHVTGKKPIGSIVSFPFVDQVGYSASSLVLIIPLRQKHGKSGDQDSIRRLCATLSIDDQTCFFLIEEPPPDFEEFDYLLTEWDSDPKAR